MKRSRFDIVAGIVQDCFLPKNKTQVMTRSSLSFPQVNKYLDLLVANGLVLAEKGVYRTAEKGREFLAFYDHLVGMLDSSSRARFSVPEDAVRVRPLIVRGSNEVIRRCTF